MREAYRPERPRARRTFSNSARLRTPSLGQYDDDDDDDDDNHDHDHDHGHDNDHDYDHDDDHDHDKIGKVEDTVPVAV